MKLRTTATALLPVLLIMLQSNLIASAAELSSPDGNIATDPRAEKLKGNSFAKELAGAIIYTSPLPVFSGAHENYMANPTFDVLKAIPST